MKKLLVLLIVLLLVSPALAATKHKKAKAKPTATPVETPVATQAATPVATPVAETSTSHWVLQIQGGGDFIMSNTIDAVTLNSPGWDGEGSLGYAPSNDFSLSLLSGYHVYMISGTPSGTTASVAYTPIEMVAQFNLPGDGVRLYGLVGIGVAINDFNMSLSGVPVTGATGNSLIQETDFLVSPGLGLSFKLSDKINLFVQGKLDMDFCSQNLADYITAFSHSTKQYDTPQLYIPVQFGLNFSMN